jgi:hypothetical protein
VTSATRSGYSANYTLKTNQAAKCRAASSLAYGYAALYDDIASDAAGLVHTKFLTLGLPKAQTVYAVCKANGSNSQAKVTIKLQ